MAISADVMAAKPSEGEAPSDRTRSHALTFEEVYAQGFPHVVRWIRAFGGLDADLDDLAQETFVVVRRQLPKFDGTNLAGWLYRITQRTVKDYRELAWFRHVLGKGHDDRRALHESTTPQLDPSEVLEHREAIGVLTQLLAKMSDSQRTAFILFEIEGYTGEESRSSRTCPSTPCGRVCITRARSSTC
jgi:RNA polymerase sigma factor (sigma-70 family)